MSGKGKRSSNGTKPTANGQAGRPSSGDNAASRKEPALFPVDRALDLATGVADFHPWRIHWVAFPLHVADVAATVRTRESFDLLDEFVSLAILDGEFRSAAAIAAFFGVSEHMVNQVLRFLTVVGHVAGSDGALELTEPGVRATRDHKRYVEKTDRITVYCDGVRADPLPAAYYRKSAHIMTAQQLADGGHGRFRKFLTRGDFRFAAISDLTRRADRADYNMPYDYADLMPITDGIAYLPCYLITSGTGSSYRSLAYSGINDTRDDAYLGELIADWPAFRSHLDDPEYEKKRRAELERWVHNRGLSNNDLDAAADGSQRLLLPPGKFLADRPAKAKGEFPLGRLGMYITPASEVVQLWCADPATRREAALLSGVDYKESGIRERRPEEIAAFLRRRCAQLEIEELDLGQLRAYAEKTGRTAK